jgi:DNA-binding GntR family transcriptional regulator
MHWPGCLASPGMTREIERGTSRPIYAQLADLLRDMIRSGEVAPRYPLPSKRALRQQHGVADGTVKRAVGILRDEGLVETVQGLGVFVRPVSEWAEPP